MKLNQIIFTHTILLFSLLLFTACGSDHDDHEEVPVGLVLTSNGTEIAMQEESIVTYTEGNSIVVPEDGQITVGVQFIADDGDWFTPHVDEGYGLAITTGNSQMLNFTHPIDNNEWTFALIGLTTGSTTITFELMHVGHSDFESSPFQVTVSENLPE